MNAYTLLIHAYGLLDDRFKGTGKGVKYPATPFGADIYCMREPFGAKLYCPKQLFGADLYLAKSIAAVWDDTDISH